MDGGNDTFIGDRDLESEANGDAVDASQPTVSAEPAELIVARVVFALIVSVSLVMNLLLLLAVIRRRRTVHVIYCLATAMIIPDVIFYSKLVVELMNWGEAQPTWARSNWSCGLWQMATHWYPILYAVLLMAIVYHAFVTLFLDYSGGYEESCRKYFPLVLTALVALTVFVAAPSAVYGVAKADVNTSPSLAMVPTHFRQYCDLDVPSLVTVNETPEVRAESVAAYRLAYELILPFILPMLLLAFPYVTLMVGLMRSIPAASHSEHPTKITVVVTLWLLTSYLVLHMSTITRVVFSVFSVWHKLMAIFDAYDDTRVPKFETYIHVVAYACTCTWGVVRAALCFKYNARLRKALGP